jgi:hypothetical protein
VTLNVKSENSTEKTKMTENIQKYPNVNRVEVISNEDGDIFGNGWDECSEVEVSIHNDGKTLRLFLKANIK